MANLINKGVSFVKDFFKHWNTPYKGRYVPNKEVMAYSVGGIGVHFATVITGVFSLSATNLFLGSCLNIRPMHLQWMLTVANILGFLITAVRSYCYDNIKSKDGKFRPYLKWMGIPTVAISVIFVWLPYNSMDYLTKCIIIEIMYLLVNCFSPFYSESFLTLLQVMSPDSDERTDIMSVSQLIYSLAPSITNMFIPLIAAKFTGGLTDIRTYRIIYPIISIIGLFIAFPVYKYTHERIIKPRSQENEIRFMDAIRIIVKNKYFWIINIAAWIGFLEPSYSVILQWSFVYQYPDKQAYLGLVNTVIGNAGLWSLLAAPFLIRMFGKRNMLIGTNIINIMLLLLLYPFQHNIVMVIAIFFINNFILILGNVYNPGIQADMKDYQQYISGERIDGMFGVVGMIGTVIGFGTGFVSPYIYEIQGLKDDYDVLYDPTVRGNLFRALIIASVIGATLNVIPFFFYDLTEKKQKGISRVLRIRAMFDDHSMGVLTDDTLIKAMQIIHTAKSCVGEEKQAITRDEIRKARALPHKTAEEKKLRSEQIEIAKKNFKQAKEHNIDVELSPFIMDEMNKFTQQRYIEQLKIAEIICKYKENNLNSLYKEIAAILQEHRNTLSVNGDKAQKKLEHTVISDIADVLRNIKRAQTLRVKNYPNGIPIEPDSDALENAQSLSAETVKQNIRRKFAVKRAVKERSVYKHSMKPFTDAEKLIESEKMYKCMDELEKLYEEALTREQLKETEPVGV